ncbi:MAG TPA: aspartate aminotransferase family protein [Candidatus Acidoferrum sp.]|nr:aspartate aminotransferase family protein [Candidatus Acidoferrum sp.]
MSARSKVAAQSSASRKAARKPSRAHSSVAILRDADQFLLPTYKRQPILFTHGRGCHVYDSRGKKYLDFLGGIAVNALGHAHPRIVKVIQRESARAIHLSNLFHHSFQGPLARKLAEWSGMDRAFFANSGAEAVEGALKLARLYGRTPAEAPGTAARKHRILAMDNSFHGRTFGAVSVTSTEKYRLPFAPLVPGVEFVRFNDIADLDSKFDDTVCAILLETIQGEGGIHPVSESFWNRARQLTAQSSALLIADEIQCGLGRTGRFFTYQKFSSKPDVVLVAKPLAAGLPLGAVLTTEAVAQRISPGLHGTTFGGGPLACAAALEFLNIVEDEKLLENVQSRGAELRDGLAALSAKFPFIREVRGEGLMIGVELSIDGAPFVSQALQNGLLINCTHDYTLRFLPPFLITRAQVRQFLGLLEKLFVTHSRKASASEPAQSASPARLARAAAR